MLEVAEEERIAGPAARAHGDVLVRSQVVGFKKIKFFTNENVGSGKLELPENEMHTTSFWLTLGHRLLADLPFSLSERQSGIFGLLYALGSMATLLMMCDRRDLAQRLVNARPARLARSIGKISRQIHQPGLRPKNSLSPIFTSTTLTQAGSDSASRCIVRAARC